MANLTLRQWLKIQPIPHKVRYERSDGSERTYKLNDSRSRMRDAENVLRGAVVCEALNADDETLRMWECEPEGRIPDAVNGGVTNPMQMVTEISKLILEAGDRGAQRHAEAYQVAFEHQSRLLETVVNRLTALEEAYHDRVMAEGEPLPAPGESENTKLVKHILEVAAPVAMHALMGGDKSTPPNGATS